jgi:uncharacterized membrane protein
LVELAAGRAGGVTTFLKFLHIATIAIWSGGLVAVPFLLWQRGTLDAGPDLDRLHRMTRFVHVGISSPAAFVAIGSGTALIFLQSTFQEWFSLKMLFVGAMAILHVLVGLELVRVFSPDGRFGLLAHVAQTSVSLALITAILWIVLAKPHIDSTQFAVRLFEPGALRQFFAETIMPMP